MKSIMAALMFFTRLPFWRLKIFQIPSGYFNQVINYWAVMGILTGGIMALVLWISALILPYSIAVIIALSSRLLITGALHEDGLADFFDGFGGGNSRERILIIMKDSHIGTYGVVGLIFYFLLLYSLLGNMDVYLGCVAILVGDPVCKLISSFITCFLPYARTAETSKAKTIYTKITGKTLIISIFFGLVPLFLFLNYTLLLALIFPILIFFLLVFLMRRKLQGYTGDCCGALFLLCELSFYLGVTIFSKNIIL